MGDKRIMKLPEISFKALIFVLFAIGLAIGFSTAYMLETEEEEQMCKALEQDIQEELPYGENTACYPPGHIIIEEEDVDQVELECTCRIIFEGELELYPIYTSSVAEEVSQP